MPQSREETCRQTARKLRAAAPTLSGVKATVGFDGFVDEIIAVVDKRHDLHHYDPIATIEQFGEKIEDAAGHSANYELVVKHMKLGGNGPIMANALGAVGMGVTYIGAVGYPAVHPVFQELARRTTVIPLGEPGHTDALEFSDGKLMLGKYTKEMSAINWENLETRVGADRYRKLMEESTLVGMVNWVMLPFMNQIWEHMLSLGVPNRTGRPRTLFVDLCDPEKRTKDDIRAAMQLLTRFQKHVDVVLGLNLSEASQIARVLGHEVGGEPELVIARTAAEIRQRLGIACVVVHPRRGAAAATEKGQASFAGPFVHEPKISTGAGDHFNAGFALGRVLGMGLEESLCTGVATSGYYVRTAESPTAQQLADFIENLPPPQ